MTLQLYMVCELQVRHGITTKWISPRIWMVIEKIEQRVRVPAHCWISFHWTLGYVYWANSFHSVIFRIFQNHQITYHLLNGTLIFDRSQLSCSGTCQVWMRFKESNRSFWKTENLDYSSHDIAASKIWCWRFQHQISLKLHVLQLSSNER